MKKMVLVLLALLMVLAVASLTMGSSQNDKQMQEGFDLEAAKASFEEYCSKCHSIDRPLGKQKDRNGWETTVSRMSDYHKRFGAPIPEETRSAIIEYLVSVAGK